MAALEELARAGGPAVQVYETRDHIILTVVRPRGQVLPDEWLADVTHALGLNGLAPAGEASPPSADTAPVKEQEERFGYLAEQLGRVGIGGYVAAETSPREPRKRRQPESLANRRRLLFDVQKRLVDAGVDMEDFVARLDLAPQRAYARLFLNMDKVTPNEGLLEATGLRAEATVRRNVDVTVQAAHRLYPKVITADLLETLQPQIVTHHNEGRQVGSVVGAIAKRAGIPYIGLERELGWPVTTLSRVVHGRAHPDVTSFQGLILAVNNRLALMSAEVLEAKGLRVLSDDEVAQLIEQYRQEKVADTTDPAAAAGQNHD